MVRKKRAKGARGQSWGRREERERGRLMGADIWGAVLMGYGASDL